MARKDDLDGIGAGDNKPADKGIIAGADVGPGRDVLGSDGGVTATVFGLNWKSSCCTVRSSAPGRSESGAAPMFVKIKRERAGKIPGYREWKCRRLGRPLINVEAGLDRAGDIRNRNSTHLARQRVIDRAPWH